MTEREPAGVLTRYPYLCQMGILSESLSDSRPVSRLPGANDASPASRRRERGEITLLGGETQNVDLIVDVSTEPIDSRHLTLPPLGYWTFVYAEAPSGCGTEGRLRARSCAPPYPPPGSEIFARR